MVQVYTCSDVVVDDADEIALLVFDQPLCVGEGMLAIEFSGELNEKLCGFYKW